MEKRKETTQKMEAVAKKLIRYSFLEGVEKWPPECLGLYYQPHRPEKALPKRRSINNRNFLVKI